MDKVIRENQGDQNCDEGQMDTSNNNQDLDIDVSISYNGAVNKEANKLRDGCIAHNKDGSILTRLSKRMEGDFVVMA